MRFRVEKNLSEKSLHLHMLSQAKTYCDSVLKHGYMSSIALAEQRKLMQYYEAWIELRDAPTTLPGQMNFLDEEHAT